MENIKVSLRDEKELTQCIKNNPESVESGLKIIDTFFKLSNGREIDILAVDKDNNLVVMELKKDQDDTQLTQALDYYDWVLNNIDTLRRLFPNTKFESVPPRIVLVAKKYTDNIILLAKYLHENVDITLYRYIAIKQNEDKAIICNDEAIPDVPEIFNPTTEEELYDYITDEDVRKKTKNLVKSIRAFNSKVTAEVKNWWGFSIKYNGRVFGSIEIKRKYIHCLIKLDVFDDESWDGYSEVKSKKDFEDSHDKFIEGYNNASKKLDNR